MIASAGRFGPALSDAAIGPVIDRAFTRGRPRAVALVVNSPGGSPVQSSLIAARIRRLAHEAAIAIRDEIVVLGAYPKERERIEAGDIAKAALDRMSEPDGGWSAEQKAERAALTATNGLLLPSLWREVRTNARRLPEPVWPHVLEAACLARWGWNQQVLAEIGVTP